MKIGDKVRHKRNGLIGYVVDTHRSGRAMTLVQFLDVVGEGSPESAVALIVWVFASELEPVSEGGE